MLTQPQFAQGSPDTVTKIDESWTGTLGFSRKTLNTDEANIRATIGGGTFTINRGLLSTGKVTITYDFRADEGNDIPIGPGVFQMNSFTDNLISSMSLFINGIFVNNVSNVGQVYTVNIPTEFIAENMRLEFNVGLSFLNIQRFSNFKIISSGGTGGSSSSNTCGY